MHHDLYKGLECSACIASLTFAAKSVKLLRVSVAVPLLLRPLSNVLSTTA